MFRVICFIILLLAAFKNMAFNYNLEISEKKLQKTVQSMMPMVKKKFFITVTLSDPQIHLIEATNEIAVYTHINVKFPKGVSAGEISSSGKLKIKGTLSYKSDTGQFFYKNPVIEKLEIHKVSEKYMAKLKTMIQLVAKQTLEILPVYTLKDDNLKNKLAKAMLQSITVKDKKLLLEMNVL